MIETIIVKHLAVNNHTEGISARWLVAPGAAGVPPIVCSKCGLSCSASNEMTFIDWDLNEFLVCPPCFELEMYHKIAMRRVNQLYFLQKELARALGVPFE